MKFPDHVSLFHEIAEVAKAVKAVKTRRCTKGKPLLLQSEILVAMFHEAVHRYTHLFQIYFFSQLSIASQEDIEKMEAEKAALDEKRKRIGNSIKSGLEEREANYCTDNEVSRILFIYEKF